MFVVIDGIVEMENKREKRSRTICLRLTVPEYRKLEEKWQKTTFKKLSDFLRSQLMQKPVVATFRNRSIDDLVPELRQLRLELNRIGVNFNQSVKKLHVLHETPEFKRWLTTHELEKKTIANKLDEIRGHVQKIVEIWLQG